MESDEHGEYPEGEGWYILNAVKGRWSTNPAFGNWIGFEGVPRFEDFGVNIHVLEPGQPACKYHNENCQEGFLVLSGNCRLLVEGEERILEAWDYFHCPSGTSHVLVGGEGGPCAVLMIGRRSAEMKYEYPASELAGKYGASAATTTNDPREAYAGRPESGHMSSPWPLP